MITYSTSSPVMPAFCRAAEMAIPPSSTAGMSLREPDNLPTGVRAPPTMTDPGIVRLLLSFRLVKIRERRVNVVPHQVPLAGHGARWQVVNADIPIIASLASAGPPPGSPSMSNADVGHRQCVEGPPGSRSPTSVTPWVTSAAKLSPPSMLGSD